VRAAVYARVSTAEQSTGMQVAALREYIARRGWTIADEYVDEGFSGSRDRRPALDRLMVDARRRAFDSVVVFRFDRFARSVAHLARSLDEFRALGIDFVSLHETIDTSTPLGRMVFHVSAAFAELERSLIIERVRSGLAHAKKRGKRLGRRPAMINVERVCELVAQGQSRRAVARALGVSEGTIRNVLGAAKKTLLQAPIPA
jgi:DNA invertase Pin-like site-specific DNA recombinase